MSLFAFSSAVKALNDTLDPVPNGYKLLSRISSGVAPLILSSLQFSSEKRDSSKGSSLSYSLPLSLKLSSVPSFSRIVSTWVIVSFVFPSVVKLFPLLGMIFIPPVFVK